MAVDDQAHKLPEPLIRQVARPRQPRPGRLVINADRGPAPAVPVRLRLMI
jgi:hypothetical protein